MEQAKDRYEELEDYLGIKKAKNQLNQLSEDESQDFNKIKYMIELFDEMKKNAINFEFIKEMYLNDKIPVDDDFGMTYDEYITLQPRTNCLMTKFEYEKMKGIIYDRHNTNKR